MGRRHARADDCLVAGHRARGRRRRSWPARSIFCRRSVHSPACEAPKDRPLDGYDITPALTGGKSPRQEMFFYRSYELMAARLGPWKAHFLTQAGYGQPQADEARPAAAI